MALVRLTERTAVTSHHMSAATASPEWRQTRDDYINHLMHCRACHAPTGRHCAVGMGLRATYDSTSMERPINPPAADLPERMQDLVLREVLGT
ncbi:hypothetical protein D3C85_1723460 [compost metagenome]